MDQLERAEAQGPPLILHGSRGIERLPTHDETVGGHLPGQPGIPQRASHLPGQRQPSLRREAQPERGGDIGRPEILGPHAHVERASGIDGPGSVQPGSIHPGLGVCDPDAPGLRGQMRLGVVDPLPAHPAAVERNLARHQCLPQPDSAANRRGLFFQRQRRFGARHPKRRRQAEKHGGHQRRRQRKDEDQRIDVRT